MKHGIVVLLAGCSLLSGQDALRRELWNAPEVRERIEEGIRVNRTGWGAIDVRDASGKPLAGVEIQAELVRHHFPFGANGFMVGGFQKAEENSRFEKEFCSLFNFVTVPFYWKGIEPKQGTLRFESTSEPVYRRPPPDTVLAFAKKNGLAVKGHTLIWDNATHQLPDWLPTDVRERERLQWEYITRVAQRYGDVIPTWDVANEAISRHIHVPMPRDYVYRAFDLANRLFPPNTTLILNETTALWSNDRDEYSPFYLLVSNLLARGARVGAVGLQFHFFSEKVHFDAKEGRDFTPSKIFRILDLYARLNRPLHITEITIPALPFGADGERAQGEMTRDFYRAWFSHPAVGAITWWNLVDDTAVPGEDKWKGGLLRRDFSAKPSYEALRKLIREEWTTRWSGKTGGGGSAQFRGFHGNYKVTIRHQGQTREVDLLIAPGTGGRVEVKL